jgi:hypothetical protein
MGWSFPSDLKRLDRVYQREIAEVIAGRLYPNFSVPI